jgi:hypothetical protein
LLALPCAFAVTASPCFNEGVSAENLREFALRARSQVAAAKRDHWRGVMQSGDGLAAFDAGQELNQYARSVSSFPDAAYLSEDLAHQVRLKQLIDRASQASASRRSAR